MESLLPSSVPDNVLPRLLSCKTEEWIPIQAYETHVNIKLLEHN